MKCFEKLVKCKFIANVSAELSLARRTVMSAGQSALQPYLYASYKDKKALYDEYVYHYYLYEEMLDSMDKGMEPDMIYFVTIDDIMFVYSQLKSQVSETITYNYNVSGGIPLYKGRCRINKKTIYTALYDKRLCFDAISPN